MMSFGRLLFDPFTIGAAIVTAGAAAYGVQQQKAAARATASAQRKMLRKQATDEDRLAAERKRSEQRQANEAEIRRTRLMANVAAQQRPGAGVGASSGVVVKKALLGA